MDKFKLVLMYKEDGKHEVLPEEYTAEEAFAMAYSDEMQERDDILGVVILAVSAIEGGDRTLN